MFSKLIFWQLEDHSNNLIENLSWFYNQFLERMSVKSVLYKIQRMFEQLILYDMINQFVVNISCQVKGQCFWWLFLFLLASWSAPLRFALNLIIRNSRFGFFMGLNIFIDEIICILRSFFFLFDQRINLSFSIMVCKDISEGALYFLNILFIYYEIWFKKFVSRIICQKLSVSK